MLDLSPDKLLVVAVIGLSVLGPQGLVRLARGLGRAREHLRRLTAEVPAEAVQVLANPRGAFMDAISGPRRAVSEAVGEPGRALAGAFSDMPAAGAPADPNHN